MNAVESIWLFVYYWFSRRFNRSIKNQNKSQTDNIPARRNKFGIFLCVFSISEGISGPSFHVCRICYTVETQNPIIIYLWILFCYLPSLPSLTLFIYRFFSHTYLHIFSNIFVRTRFERQIKSLHMRAKLLRTACMIGNVKNVEVEV